MTRRTLREILVLIVAIGLPASAAGQTVTDQRLWTGVAVQGRAGARSPWRWAADSLVRTRDGARTLDFLAGRVTLGRDVTRRSSVSLGYAYGSGFPGDGGTIGERRLMQQYTWSDTTATRRLSFRKRLEQRFIQGQGRVLLRARQQVRAAWPIGSAGRVQAVASEEVFIALNATALAARGLDGNRLFVGIRQAVTARSAVETGYVHVYAHGRAGRDRQSHVVSATFLVSF